MTKLPVGLFGREVQTALERAGFVFRRQTGSHIILRRYPVTGGDVFDLQIIATMQANSLQRIYTFNTADFEAFAELSIVTPLNRAALFPSKVRSIIGPLSSQSAAHPLPRRQNRAHAEGH